MKKSVFVGVIALLVLLFAYTGMGKLFDMDTFTGNMRNQRLPGWLTTVLIWGLPVAEMLVVLCLLFRKTQRTGLIASLALLIIYSIYILALLLHFFPKVPCPCGGIFRRMSWEGHFLFNIAAILLAILALILDHYNRRSRQSIFHL